MDIVTYKAVYEVIDPINENLELDRIGLRSLLSIVALSKDLEYETNIFKLTELLSTNVYNKLYLQHCGENNHIA